MHRIREPPQEKRLYIKICRVERETDMKMPNASEVIERLAREAEIRRVLEILDKAENLDEAKKKVREILTK